MDAALTIRRGPVDDSYLFRRDLVYKFIEDRVTFRYQTPWLQLEPGWPKKISDVFPGIPNDLDTAFHYGYDSRVYFFKGRNFYILDEDDSSKTAIAYPLHQWGHICDLYKCMIGPIPNYYSCESWANRMN